MRILPFGECSIAPRYRHSPKGQSMYRYGLDEPHNVPPRYRVIYITHDHLPKSPCTMKKTIVTLLLISATALVTMSSCRSNVTCPAYSNTSVQPNKKTGKLPTRKGRSNLFPKDMRRN